MTNGDSTDRMTMSDRQSTSPSEVRMTSGILKGTIRGKTIELEQAPGLPDGQQVSVTLTAATPSGEGLRRAFGGWAGAAELDAFLEQVRRDRKFPRRESGE
jgi:hypothetical protein